MLLQSGEGVCVLWTSNLYVDTPAGVTQEEDGAHSLLLQKV